MDGRFPPIYPHTGVYTDWYTASQILSMRELPIDLIQADGIAGAVIQLGCTRRLAVGPLQRVVRDLLRMLNCTTILEVGGDARRAEGVAAGRLRQSSLPQEVSS